MKTTRFIIEIDEFDHAAMADAPAAEVARVLRQLAERAEEYGLPNLDGTVLADSNGNAIGLVEVAWEEDEEVEEWDEDLSTIRTIEGRYGSGKTLCNLFVCDEYLWYCVEGSRNMNKAPWGTEFEDGIWIEPIEDVDTMTVEPVQSEEEFARHIWERESE